MSKKRANPDGTPHIPRPHNAWILFRSEWYRNHGAEYKSKGVGEMSRAASRVWRALSEDQKLFWALRSVEVALDHSEKYPEYKFRPRTSKEKGAVKGKRKGKAKGVAAAQEEGGSQLTRPKKKRRMGEPLTNSALEAPMSGMLSVIDWAESSASAGPSSAIEAGEPSSSVDQVNIASPSFATHNQYFTFAMPYLPLNAGYSYTNYANVTGQNDENAFHFIEQHQVPYAEVHFGQDTYATVPSGDTLNDTYTDPGYSSYSEGAQSLSNQALADASHDPSAYHFTGDYYWPPIGSYEISQFEVPLDYENYNSGDSGDNGIYYSAHSTTAVA